MTGNWSVKLTMKQLKQEVREGGREGGGEEREKSFCGYSVSIATLIIGFGVWLEVL